MKAGEWQKDWEKLGEGNKQRNKLKREQGVGGVWWLVCCILCQWKFDWHFKYKVASLKMSLLYLLCRLFWLWLTVVRKEFQRSSEVTRSLPSSPKRLAVVPPKPQSPGESLRNTYQTKCTYIFCRVLSCSSSPPVHLPKPFQKQLASISNIFTLIHAVCTFIPLGSAVVKSLSYRIVEGLPIFPWRVETHLLIQASPLSFLSSCYFSVFFAGPFFLPHKHNNIVFLMILSTVFFLLLFRKIW